MEKPVSNRVLLMRKAWLKAFSNPEPIRFEFQTTSGAVRGRMDLYNAVKEAKQGIGDPELVKAAQGVEICRDGKTAIIMRRLADSDFIKTIEAGLGEKLDEQQDPVLRELEERLNPREPQTPGPEGLAPITGNYGPFANMKR